MAEKERKVELMRIKKEDERRVRLAKKVAQREEVKDSKEIVLLHKTIEAKEKVSVGVCFCNDNND